MTSSSPARGTWIEIGKTTWFSISRLRSSPARGTWIEIGLSDVKTQIYSVVPRTGDVD